MGMVWTVMKGLATHFMPFPYVHMLKVLLCIWVFTVPFAITGVMGEEGGVYVTPVVTLILSMALFGIEAIGEELENPLGLDLNDLEIMTWEKNCLRLCSRVLINTRAFKNKDSIKYGSS